ncbi:MAG: diguanylate cyclase [Kordiimonas sp.]
MPSRLVNKLLQSGSPVKESRAAAVLIAVDNTVDSQSPSASVLVNMWNQGHAALHKVVAEVRETGVVGEYHLEASDGAKIWVTAVQRGKTTLLVARDTELVETMAEALLESRILLKSLLDGAVDLSFEVGLDGRFRFVSPADAFGELADGWIGKKVEDIFWPKGNVPARNPFLSKVQKQFDSVSTEIGGQKRYLAISVEPSVNNKGVVKGVRGSCRDITARVEEEHRRRQDHLRIAVQQRITHILNTSENAYELLEYASRELIDVLRADLVWSVMKHKNGLVPASFCGDRAEVLDFDMIWQKLTSSARGVQTVEGKGRDNLALLLERGGVEIGMVLIGRDTSTSPWSKQERQLLEDVGDVLTAAFNKAELIDKLYRLSGKDELTDLLNRRAFVDVVERRLKHQCRTGQSGCLVFIDLDHFKEVNDTLGHKAGDEAIMLVANKLQNIIRASDHAGRFGGDEFVMWIEDADEETAESKAQMLLDYMPTVREKIGNVDLRLGASVGICRSVPGVDLKLMPLAERADQALYEVKQAGKNAIAFAKPAASEEIES